MGSHATLYETRAGKTGFLLTLFVGLVFGVCLSQIVSYLTIPGSFKPAQIITVKSQQVDDTIMDIPQLVEQPKLQVRLFENTTGADHLKKEVRILCWVMTNPTNHKKVARHVKRTWGKRCNILLFMSSAIDSELPTVKLNVSEGRENLWTKTREAFKFVYKHYYNDADWFFKADDDTYAVVENMRYMLYPYSPKTPVYFGFKFKPIVRQGYMSGGAGYVVSKEALRRLVVDALPNPQICLPAGAGAEDAEVGKCFQNVNVTAGDSRDVIGRNRMFPFQPMDHLIPSKDKAFWYWEYMYYQTDDGLDACSDNAITFHYVTPQLMYMFDYLIYHLKPFGVFRSQQLPAKLEVGELMKPPKEEPANSNEDSFDDDDRIYTTEATSNVKEPDAREVD